MFLSAIYSVRRAFDYSRKRNANLELPVWWEPLCTRDGPTTTMYVGFILEREKITINNRARWNGLFVAIYSPPPPRVCVCVCVLRVGHTTMEVSGDDDDGKRRERERSPLSAKLPASLLYNDHWTATTTYLATLSLSLVRECCEMERLMRRTMLRLWL